MPAPVHRGSISQCHRISSQPSDQVRQAASDLRPSHATIGKVKRFPLWVAALAVTTLMQATSAFLLSAMTVLGPTLTEAARVRAERIGDLAAVGAFGTMVFLAGGGPFLNRFGPVR